MHRWSFYRKRTKAFSPYYFISHYRFSTNSSEASNSAFRTFLKYNYVLSISLIPLTRCTVDIIVLHKVPTNLAKTCTASSRNSKAPLTRNKGPCISVAQKLNVTELHGVIFHNEQGIAFQPTAVAQHQPV